MPIALPGCRRKALLLLVLVLLTVLFRLPISSGVVFSLFHPALWWSVICALEHNLHTGIVVSIALLGFRICTIFINTFNAGSIIAIIHKITFLSLCIVSACCIGRIKLVLLRRSLLIAVHR